MDIATFRKKIKTNPVQPIYFLYGDESFYIDNLGKFIVDLTVSPEMKDFNYSVLYGKEVDTATVLDALMRYPMMAEYQVIHLKEAHQMKSFADLLPYLNEPLESTIFIIEYKNSVDKRFKVFKTLTKLETAFESASVRDYQITQWIRSDALMRYPMMAEYQVIHLKEAHQMKSFADLLPYLNEPLESTIFIIEYKNSVDKRFKVFKTLTKLETAFESASVRDYQITQWI